MSHGLYRDYLKGQIGRLQRYDSRLLAQLVQDSNGELAKCLLQNDPDVNLSSQVLDALTGEQDKKLDDSTEKQHEYAGQ